ncbi:phage scaffolding protein [Pseudomonas mosselii]|uniref:phage scaffolding protein n=1 Tax=Pseudomonas mosselii TaxID=78327 RepID=UPI002022FB37|nr:phage scaffolding protein [Pseudomonas mosselii]MCL8299431.1 phage scaffolding protein [Pseudomonas mosselii]MCL8339711.1 phage scaffolding protein [Pseudomonas mosselii]
MSEVKRYARMGELVEANPALLKLYPAMTVYVLGDDFDRVAAERDALQQRLNAADQQIDELTLRKAEPVQWGAPKTVRQLIQQLETLDQDLRPLSMLRVPGKVFDDGKDRTRAVHLSFSHERVEGQWLAPFKGDGEKVVAFWCRMEQPEPLHNFAMIGIERMPPMEYDEP